MSHEADCDNHTNPKYDAMMTEMKKMNFIFILFHYKYNKYEYTESRYNEKWLENVWKNEKYRGYHSESFLNMKKKWLVRFKFVFLGLLT